MLRLDTIKNQFTNGTISRRQFMDGALAMGMTVAAATMFTAEVSAATPKKGGRMRYGSAHGSTTDSFDPGSWENGYTGNLAYMVYNHLFEVNTDGQLEPELVEEAIPSNGAKTWTFKLRQGVQFNTGKTMDADDVVASIEFHRGEDSKSAGKPLLGPVTTIKATDKHTVVFELTGGNADFPFTMSDYHFAIKPSKDGKIDPTKMDGTGGYTIVEHEAGVRTLLKRNPNYFKAGRAHFDEIEMISIIDVNARTSALKTGEVDLIDRADLKTVHLLAKTPGIRVEEVTGTKHYTFPMNSTVGPFDNNDVRMALKFGIDREAIVKTVLRGHGVVGNDHPIAPSNPYYAADLPQHTYDTDKAKFHLKKAGLTSLNVPFHTADAAFPGAVDAGILYKEQAARAGINIDVVREPNDGYWSNVWMAKPFVACYWGGRPTEDQMFSTAYASGADWNDTYWEHGRFNELLVMARAETNTDNRRAMYYEMQDIVSNEGSTIVPMFANYVWAVADNVQHGKMAGNWDTDGQKWCERWWFS